MNPRTPHPSAHARALFPFVLAGALVACLDPLVSDEVARPDLVLPAGSEVPDLTADPNARAALDRADGVDGDYIPLRSAFAHGERVWYWDLGPASPAPIPLYMLVEEAEQGAFETPQGRFNPLPDHPPIFDAIPGDPGYSPWWLVVLWPVTERFAGEVITSFAAMDEAFRQGLVRGSVTVPLAINCPIVLPEARLEAEPGDASSALTPNIAYYKGSRVYYFSFSAVPVDALAVATPPVYRLRREGGEPLSESERGVDMTRDGDLLDSNDLFAAAPGDPDYTDMVSVVDAVVTDGEFIDRSGSDATSDLMRAADLFSDGAPDPDRTIALHPLGTVLNLPIRPPPTDTEAR